MPKKVKLPENTAELSSKYNPHEVETGKNAKWIKEGFFSQHDASKKPYSIILPPPNVTGKLHLGHAWDSYIQDTLIRYKKLQGFDVLFVPGLDHAGIATQAKVEERLWKEEKLTRHDLGRDKFLARVWAWKNDYANLIHEQWAKLGIGLDYHYERFTMDKGLSEAVTRVFIEWYQAGLIYRGKRAINWDPILQTVVSNIEVEMRATESIMYYVHYSLVEGGTISIATVRPETMYADVAVAVNPRDKKWNHLIGQFAVSPLTKRKLPIIADKSIEINKGTGAMKVSAHAEEDFRIITEHNLELREVIDAHGKLNELAGDLAGQDSHAVRPEIARRLGKALYRTEKITNNVGYSQRSGAVVEVLVQPQWFVSMKPLAEKVLANLKTAERVKFKPARFGNDLKRWLNNIEDWCISRQLWWGHQIPAWYRGEEVKVQTDSPGKGWKQDPDVLDTWFSSGLAPFSFLGWPNDFAELARFYPVSTLVTGYDILFFWVARMYFASLDFMHQKPFDEVLIHGLIRGEDGRKMSKSLGNGVDPMDVINEYGSDALRYFLLTNSTPGQDIRYSPAKVAAAWNLCNKLWNVARLVLASPEGEKHPLATHDYWITNQLAELTKELHKAYANKDFARASKKIQTFLFEDFSGWYLELSKAQPNAAIMRKTLTQLLIILHPLLPFVTDHLHLLLTGEELLNSQWPKIRKVARNFDDLEIVIALVRALREWRATKNISHKEELVFSWEQPLTAAQTSMLKKLANAVPGQTSGALLPIAQGKLYVAMHKSLETNEAERFAKTEAFLRLEIQRAKNILNNPHFKAKASPEVVTAEIEKLKRYQAQLATLLAELKR